MALLNNCLYVFTKEKFMAAFEMISVSWREQERIFAYIACIINNWEQF